MKKSKFFKALCILMSITVLAVTVPVIRAKDHISYIRGVFGYSLPCGQTL